MSRAPFLIILKTLWRMLTTRRRLIFASLIGLIFVASLLDMTGMLFIFGFIQGLKVDPATGERGGRLVKVFELAGVDTAIPTASYVLIAGGGVLAVLAFKNIVSTLVQFGLRRFLMKLNQRVSEGLLDGYLLVPYESLLSEGASVPGGKIRRIFDVFSSCFSAVAQLFADGILVLVVILLLSLISPLLTIGAASVFALAGALTYIVMQKTLVAMGRREKEARSEASLYLEDGIHGLLDIRLRDARGYIRKGYSHALQQTALLQRRIQALQKFPQSSNEMLLGFMVVGGVWYLSQSGQELDAALPTLVIFGYAGKRLTGALTRINKTLQNLRRKAEEFEDFAVLALSKTPESFGYPAERRDGDYLSEEQPLPKSNDGRLHGELRVEGVTFRYPTADLPALRNVSLSIPRGSFVAFCGPSGGGKSTLALILLGLLRPTEGRVLCDDWNIQEHIRAWHRNVGYVSQKVYLSGRNIRENVAFGVPVGEIDDKKVWTALEKASASKFVKRFPKKLRHVLKEMGANLSGGERQRLLIARALYHEPEVIVFDEATAALDNTTEREITSALSQLSRDRTIICIAHRLSTIRNCDQIFVVEDGAIVGQGKYEFLVEENSTFRSLAAGGIEKVPPQGRNEI